MVKKKKVLPDTIPEAERLKLQLLNAYVDPAQESLDKYKVMLENAKLGLALAQRDVDVAKANLENFGKELALEYEVNFKTDSLNFETGEIRRNIVEETDES